MQLWLERTVARWAARDRRWAGVIHRGAAWPLVLLAFVFASRAGDGVLWVLLIAVLPLLDGARSACALQMLGAGALNLAVYRYVKRRVGRPRPFVTCPDIRACARALDDFSFPSGHTLHAVCFAIVIGFHYPAAAWVVGPFALLVAASRMVLGLHYPSDVAVGAALGMTTSILVLAVN